MPTYHQQPRSRGHVINTTTYRYLIPPRPFIFETHDTSRLRGPLRLRARMEREAIDRTFRVSRQAKQARGMQKHVQLFSVEIRTAGPRLASGTTTNLQSLSARLVNCLLLLERFVKTREKKNREKTRRSSNKHHHSASLPGCFDKKRNDHEHHDEQSQEFRVH